MSYKLTLYIQNKSTPKTNRVLINQAGLWKYNNNAHIQNRTVRSARVQLGSFLAPDRLRPWIRRSFSVRGHDGHKIVLKIFKNAPINYCKGQRGQSLAWKPAKSHQSAVRVTSVSGTPLFSLSPAGFPLLSSTPPPPPSRRPSFSCFLANEGPPTNPNILKFMSKCYESQ